MHEMGYRGLNLLVRLMQGEEVESERLAPDFMVRASTTGIAGPPLSRVLGRHPM
jgi:LacI family transcriptional regulator